MIHCAKRLRKADGCPSPLSTVLGEAERSGKLSVHTHGIRAELPSLMAALRQPLHRQQRRGRLVRLSCGSDHWLIVPLQHAAAGVPPLEAWLDRSMSKTLAIGESELGVIAPHGPGCAQPR
jgi:hypothetical protein